MSTDHAALSLMGLSAPHRTQTGDVRQMLGRG